MSTFTVEAHKLTVIPHPNADALELAKVGGFVSCVPKGVFSTGEVALYIPEAALIPEPILKELNLTPKDGSPVEVGKPIGNGGNRVKAIRLRKQLSQGIVYKPSHLNLVEGTDYAEILGIEKWLPEVPQQMAGQVTPVSYIKSNSETENIKKFVDVLRDGEKVVVTEKIHGSACVIHFDGEKVWASSKGVAKNGLALQDVIDEHGRSKNLYWQAVHKYNIDENLPALAAEMGVHTMTLYGEVGPCQDLKYGREQGEIFLAIFDCRIDGTFVDYKTLQGIVDKLGADPVPELYVGPWSDAIIDEFTDGKTIFGNGAHIREGIVIKPVIDRYDVESGLGRVILKSISGAYLTRKNATEFN